MDKEKQPGVKFLGVRLKKLTFEINTEFPKGAQNIPLSVEFGFGSVINDKKLQCELKTELFKNAPIYPYKFEAIIVGYFETDDVANMTLDEFSKVSAPALLLPYMRELVTNVTGRTKYPPVLLPPINIVAMIAQTESK